MPSPYTLPSSFYHHWAVTVTLYHHHCFSATASNTKHYQSSLLLPPPSSLPPLTEQPPSLSLVSLWPPTFLPTQPPSQLLKQIYQLTPLKLRIPPPLKPTPPSVLQGQPNSWLVQPLPLCLSPQLPPTNHHYHTHHHLLYSTDTGSLRIMSWSTSSNTHHWVYGLIKASFTDKWHLEYYLITTFCFTLLCWRGTVIYRLAGNISTKRTAGFNFWYDHM